MSTQCDMHIMVRKASFVCAWGCVKGIINAEQGVLRACVHVRALRVCIDVAHGVLRAHMRRGYARFSACLSMVCVSGLRVMQHEVFCACVHVEASCVHEHIKSVCVCASRVPLNTAQGILCARCGTCRCCMKENIHMYASW
jgi:hypothetical protein